MTRESGVLFVVATPIGNLADLSQRQRDTLAAADLIAAEDTRHTGRLLARIGVHAPLLSLHEHNESRQIETVLGRLESGERVALVSDAGTPLISDPGFELVRAARRGGYRVSPVPGPCAAIAALSVSGLPTDRFAFEGFLPARGGPRRQRLQQLAQEPRTLIFYEGVHRLEASLEDLGAAFGAQREATVARELTKLHEQVAHGTLAELLCDVREQRLAAKGECVLVVAGAAPRDDELGEAGRVLEILCAQLPSRQAVDLAAAITGARRNALKRLLTTHSGS